MAKRFFNNRKFYPGFRRSVALLYLILSIQVYAAEVVLVSADYDGDNFDKKWFGLLDFDYSLKQEYNNEAIENIAISSLLSERSITQLSSLLHWNLSGYIYHPNFISAKLNADIGFIDESFTGGANGHDRNGLHYRYNVRLAMLPKKLYPFEIFITESIPVSADSISTGSKSAIRSIDPSHKTVGFSARLRQPLLPVDVAITASHAKNNETRADRIYDEVTDRASVDVDRRFNSFHKVHVAYEWEQRSSASGSFDLPINQTVNATNRLAIDSQHIMGETRQYRLENRFSMINRDNRGQANDIIRFSPMLTWNISDKVIADTKFFLNRNTSSDTTSTNSMVSSGIHYKMDTTSFGGKLILENIEQGSMSQDRYTLASNLSMGWLLPFGELEFSNSMRLSRTDRTSDGRELSVSGERLQFSGLQSVELGEENIRIGSIHVTNATATQTYRLDQDYRVLVIGSGTYLDTLPGGNIEDDERVLVDYTYDVGASASWDTFSQDYGLKLLLGRYLIMELNLLKDSDRSVNADSGFIPRSRLKYDYGLRTKEYWIRNWFWVTTNISSGFREVDGIASRGTQLEVNTGFKLPFKMFVHLTAIRNQLEIDSTDEDVDRSFYSIRFKARPGYGTTYNAELSSEEDTGGTIFRRKRLARVSALWHWRKLEVKAELRYSERVQGETSIRRSLISATFTRHF